MAISHSGGKHLVTACTGEQKGGNNRTRLKKLCGWGGTTEAGKQEAGMQVAVLTGDAPNCGAEGAQGVKEEEDTANRGILL